MQGKVKKQNQEKEEKAQGNTGQIHI